MNILGKKTLKNSLLGIFFIFIVVYSFFRSHDLIFGVKIKDVNLIDGTTFTASTINVTGNAKNAVKLMLNGREISIDQAGNFDETIALLPGYNVVDIKAVDKFEYTDEKNYKLMQKGIE